MRYRFSGSNEFSTSEARRGCEIHQSGLLAYFSLLLKQNCLLSCALSQCPFLFLRVSCSPGKAQIFYLPQFLILFTFPPKYWGFICVSPPLVSIVLGIEPRTLPTLHKPLLSYSPSQGQLHLLCYAACVASGLSTMGSFLKILEKRLLLLFYPIEGLGGKSLDLMDH